MHMANSTPVRKPKISISPKVSAIPKVRAASKAFKDGSFDQEILIILEKFAKHKNYRSINWPRSIGISIWNLRTDQELTQDGLALKINSIQKGTAYEDIDQSYISRVEHGRISPTWDRLSLFARALKTTVSRIIWDAERSNVFSGTSKPRFRAAVK